MFYLNMVIVFTLIYLYRLYMECEMYDLEWVKNTFQGYNAADYHTVKR